MQRESTNDQGNTRIPIGVVRDLLPGLLNEPEGLARLVDVILNQILQAQMPEHLGASPYERSPERQGDRNGICPRTLDRSCNPLSVNFRFGCHDAWVTG